MLVYATSTSWVTVLSPPLAWPNDVTPVKVVRAARGSTFPAIGLPPRAEHSAPRSAASAVTWRALTGQRAERATTPGQTRPAAAHRRHAAMKTNESSHQPTGAQRQPDQLYAPNGKRIVAAKDWIPGNALILGATRNLDGSLEIEWEGETKICWDGQYTERLGDQRIFLDEDANEWRENQLTLGSEPQPAENATSLEPTDPWAGIPDYELGEVPDSLPEEQPILYRRVIAKRAILGAYEVADDPRQGIADLLGDLRHLCDALNLDFAQLDRVAYQRYAAEKSTTSA